MEITWDELKREATLASRGMDFADITIGFFEGALIVDARDAVIWPSVNSMEI